jgi:hypothetical protein
MGCDIHLHAEIKVNGKWEHYAHPHIRRDYRLFAKMASVRNAPYGHPEHIEPVSHNQGFPSYSASVTTRLDYEHWGPDAHSASVLNITQIQQIYDYYEELYPKSLGLDYDWGFYLFGNGWDNKEAAPDEVTGWRWVFWFDN